MTTAKPKSVTTDIWSHLRQHTSARIGLGRCGGSLPTSEYLSFKLAHAQARDAVHSPFDAKQLLNELAAINIECCIVSSAAKNRREYLLRPDLGRKLSQDSTDFLKKNVSPALDAVDKGFDVSIVVSDGLSAQATSQVIPLLQVLFPLLKKSGMSITKTVLCNLGRVLIQDEISNMLNARISVMLIGERPGLGTADSLGAYLIYQPKPGKTDADRNCISNIHRRGLVPELAAQRLHDLILQSLHLKISGVELKDNANHLSPAKTSIKS